MMNKTRIITAVPLIMVNTVALIGQYGFIRDHTSLDVTGAVLFAGAIESVALYLAYMAHVTALALDSSLRLRLGAYGFGLLAGAMNYSHYVSHGYRPTFLAVATAVMSASSPWLWGIYSRRQSRDKMRELGLIEPGAVRLGFNRWLWHFRKAFAVYRLAAWDGIREPAAAITAWENRPEPEPVMAAEPEPVMAAAPVPAIQAAPVPEISAAPVARGSGKAGTVSAAFDALGWDASGPAVAQWCAARGVTVAPAYVRQIRSRAGKRAIETQRDNVRAISNGHKT